MSSGPTHYAVLGVPEDAPRARIRRAYLDLVKRLHPDKYHGDKSEAATTQAFKQVQKAYEVLSNTEKRRIYDAEHLRVAAPRPQHQSSARQPPRQNTVQRESLEEWLLKRSQSKSYKYRQFSPRLRGPSGPLVALLGVFLLFRGIPLGMMMISDAESTEELEIQG
eukprot:CAMPEP_0194510738 /NCGR_PEP_ID=MMETSP0253-20130528/42165_1 /TAXON_ID=2966 /ORGANISM="Noctiluca scintillans" /LENGTH=164 /DNA_ID=CAMNT_0039354001 /DNA_START=14 /DNA_END=505 /DNA_ORIENTATION=+